MLRLSLTGTLCVLVTLTLTGCAAFGPTEPPLPPLPADLGVCFERTVPAPAQGPITKEQVINLIADLKRSETEKTLCGQRLITFYESLL